MRIAVVTEVFLPAVDGVVTRLRRTLEELERFGDEVVVVAPAGGPPEYAGAVVVGARPLSMPLYPDGDGYPEKRVSLPDRALGRALRGFRPDVIHAVNPFLLAAGGVYYARRHRVPLVASYHANVPSYASYYRLGALEGLGWQYVRALHSCADLNLCTSRAAIETLRRKGVKRLALWPYGVEAELARVTPEGTAAWRERLGRGGPERPIVLFVGRLAKEKSVDRLVAVARELEGVSLAIVGDGPLRRMLERRFAGTATTFTGILTGEDLANAYAAADVFVFPSQSETLGLVMIEAHTLGLPVVASDSAAARELVRDGVDGLLCDPDDPGALVAAVRRLASDPALREVMSREARHAVDGASWTRATEVLREHYETVLASRRSPRGWNAMRRRWVRTRA